MILKKVVYSGATYQGYSEIQLKEIGIPDDVIDNEKRSQELVAVNTARKVAYSQEADGLYMEWQFDKTIESETVWREKVEEIKQRYPMP